MTAPQRPPPAPEEFLPDGPSLYTASQCRELDRLAIAGGLAGFELMRRAGAGAFRELLQRWPGGRRITVCCGKGNNAGDGYLLAGLARRAGLRVTLLQLGSAGDLQGDAALARDWATDQGIVAAPGSGPVTADVVVDALLGTGIRGELRPDFARMTAAINASGAPVLAIDVPTGVDADTGGAVAEAVRATLTVTFIGRKLGLHTGAGVAHAGTVVFDDLGVPPELLRAVPGCPWLTYQHLPPACRLPPRDANAYKHALGHLVVVGGDHSMGGAPLLAAEAALRCGAGMVSLLTRAGHRPAALARRPELMVVDADDASARRAVLERATTLVVGPGLGQQSWGSALLEEALALGRPTVLDADGLNGFARLGLGAAGPLIVTPHAGEAARLLDLDSAAIARDRPAAARALAQRVQGVAVLKGAGTLLAVPGDPPVAGQESVGRLVGVCAHGNPGMASAGMGDVLSGVIGSLLAQGLAAPAAAVAGTCLHSYAADLAVAEFGSHSLLATDLLGPLIKVLAGRRVD